MIFRTFVLCFAAAILLIGRVDALTKEDKEKIDDAIKPFVTKCIQEFGVSEEKVKDIKKKGDTEDLDPCFMACIFQKAGIVDHKGLYDAEKALEMTKPLITNEEDLKVIEKVSKDCAKVNDEKVNDGEKGCDRSMLVFACMMEHKDEINLSGD